MPATKSHVHRKGLICTNPRGGSPANPGQSGRWETRSLQFLVEERRKLVNQHACQVQILLDARPVAALVFRRNQHVITLFTWPSGRSSFGEVSQNGYHVVAWTQDTMTYWAVSDLSREELQQFARLYRGQ